MNTLSSPSIFELAGHGLRTWFWNGVRNSDALRSLIERISGKAFVERRFDEALRDGLNFVADFIKEKKILSERKIDIFEGAAKFMLADQAEILSWLQVSAANSWGYAWTQNQGFQAGMGKGAEWVAGMTEAARASLRNKIEAPDDSHFSKKVLATYHHYHQDGLAKIQGQVLAHEGWNNVDRLVIRKIFNILKKEAADAEFAQITGEHAEKWKAGMGILNEFLTRETPDILPHLEAYAPSVGIAIRGTQQLVGVATSMAAQTEAGVNAGLTMLADGAVALAGQVVETVDRIEVSTLGMTQEQMSVEEFSDILKAGAIQPEPAQDPVSKDGQTSNNTPAQGFPQYFPLGERAQILVEQTRVFGTVHAASVHNHAHAESPDLHVLMDQACESALNAMGQAWRPLEDAGDYLLSAAFVKQRDAMVLNFPQAPGAAPGYRATARNVGNAVWGYGMSWLGYQESAEQRRMREQLQAFHQVCGGKDGEDLMIEVSHFLDEAVAKACLLGPLDSLRAEGASEVLRLPARSGETLLRMAADGPRYAYTVERKDDGAMAVTIAASWQILAYGQGAPNLEPRDAGSSAVRSSVQVILLPRDDGAGFERKIFPLGISASIDNRIEFTTRLSACPPER